MTDSELQIKQDLLSAGYENVYYKGKLTDDVISDMEIVGRTLLDGDYIIMFSDGITDALSQGIGEEMLAEVIGSCHLMNPGEIAGHILNFCIHQCKGHIRDDMTVLVIGIWKKEEE